MSDTKQATLAKETTVVVETETGEPVPTRLQLQLQFFYECPDCGYHNELIRLNGYDRPFITLKEVEPFEILCHKCEHKIAMRLRVGEKES